jgi:hypothetical protein
MPSAGRRWGCAQAASGCLVLRVPRGALRARSQLFDHRSPHLDGYRCFRLPAAGFRSCLDAEAEDLGFDEHGDRGLHPAWRVLRRLPVPPDACIQSSAPGDDELVGISLIDGGIGACSEDHCGVVRMTVDEAIERKLKWDQFTRERGPPNPYPRHGWAPGEVRD